MRSFLLVVMLGALGAGASATTAAACPRDRLCVTSRVVHVAGVPAEMVAAARKPVRLGVTRTRELGEPVLALDVRNDQPPAHTDELEMPWIWKLIRAQAYAHMPRYAQADEGMSFMLAPVVVTSVDESTPGLGVSGDF